MHHLALKLGSVFALLETMELKSEIKSSTELRSSGSWPRYYMQVIDTEAMRSSGLMYRCARYQLLHKKLYWSHRFQVERCVRTCPSDRGLALRGPRAPLGQLAIKPMRTLPLCTAHCYNIAKIPRFKNSLRGLWIRRRRSAEADSVWFVGEIL